MFKFFLKMVQIGVVQELINKAMATPPPPAVDHPPSHPPLVCQLIKSIKTTRVERVTEIVTIESPPQTKSNVNTKRRGAARVVPGGSGTERRILTPARSGGIGVPGVSSSVTQTNTTTTIRAVSQRDAVTGSVVTTTQQETRSNAVVVEEAQALDSPALPIAHRTRARRKRDDPDPEEAPIRKRR